MAFFENFFSDYERDNMAKIDSLIQELKQNIGQVGRYEESKVFFVNKLVSMRMLERIYELKKDSIVINRINDMDSEEIDQCFDLFGLRIKKELKKQAVKASYEESLKALRKKIGATKESFNPKSLEICKKYVLSFGKIVLSRTDFYEFYSDARIKQFLLGKLESGNIDRALQSSITEIYNFLSLNQKFGSNELENDFKELFNQFYYKRKKQLETKIINEILLEILKQTGLLECVSDFTSKMILLSNVKANFKFILDFIKQCEEYSKEKEQLFQKYQQELLDIEEQYSKRSFKEQLILKCLKSNHILSGVKEENPYFYLSSSNVNLYLNYLLFSNQDSAFEIKIQNWVENRKLGDHPFMKDLEDYVVRSYSCSFEHLGQEGYNAMLETLLNFQKINKLIKGEHKFEPTEMQALLKNFYDDPRLNLRR